MAAPFFSIIIPTLNEEKYLPQLLSNLAHQTFRDFEVIIIDGHSDDATVTKAKGLAHTLPRLTIYPVKKRNVCYQRNHGASKADGSWLLFMDADNRLPPFFLQGIKYQIEVYKPQLFTTHILPDSKNRQDQIIATLTNLYLDIQKSTTHPSILESLIGITPAALKIVGGFDEKLKWGEGGYLAEAAHKKKLRYHIFKEPGYIYSLRRLKNHGTLKTVRNSATLEVSRILNLKINPRLVGQLYPMTGGNLKTADVASPIEVIVGELHHLSPRQLIKQGHGRQWLKNLFKKITA